MASRSVKAAWNPAKREFEDVAAPVVEVAKPAFTATDAPKDRQAYIDQFMIDLTGRPFTMKVAGYFVALYIPEGEEKIGASKTIIAPEQYRRDQVLKACCGFVIGQGPDAYADKARYPSGPWCELGDWVSFNRYETTAALIGYRGLTLALIPDDKVNGVVDQKEDLTDILKRDLL